MKRVIVMTLSLFCFILQGTWAQTEDVLWNGSGTDADPFLIENENDWAVLANSVNSSNSYSGKIFRLTRDLDISTGVMVGTDNRPFSGTFDGDGHTITFSSGTAASPVTTPCAPFRLVSGATIRHLTTAGTVYTKAQFAAGIVSRVSGTASTHITDCHTTMTISSTISGDGTHGGLVAVVSENTGHLYIEQCSFSGSLVNTGSNVTTSCGGFVGFARTAVTVTDGIFTPAAFTVQGVNFVRMSESNMSSGNLLTLTDCYTTAHASMNTQYPQGTFLLDHIDIDNGCAYEFVGEPDMTLNGKSYYKNGCYVRLTVLDERNFNHWKDNGPGNCFISDPFRLDGIHQLKDVRDVPQIKANTGSIPSPVTERTLWGVTYRYLSRKDYHYYVSDEDLKVLGWTFRNSNNDANLIVMTNGNESLITAITGYDESNYNIDGVQIHNDLYATLLRDHTHLGLIAPRAFKGSKKLTSLYFKDTNGNTEGARTAFKFFIGDEAFLNCTNFQELKLMQYTTTGSNQWTALTPNQVVSVADDAFAGCTNLKISAHNQQYQNYLSSETWRAHRDRFIVYEATVSDFTVEGVKYHYYRKANETGSLKNDDEGKAEMMNQIRTWNADYQQFNAADLLATNSGNVYYCYVTGVDNDKLDAKNGVMRIYNDPGSTYNYKNIALGRNAIAGNEHVKYIEFYQTNGDADNSYSDLKMVIPNGALKGCKNLKELRLFYYVEDGEDHWTILGPKDVIPGDNIFGEPTLEEVETMTEEELENRLNANPQNLRILVSIDRYQEFLDDPNWLPYINLLEPVDFTPSNKDDFTSGGLTYGYATAPGGINQTSQVVSQDVSWWTLPRIAAEVALMVASGFSNGIPASAQAINGDLSLETLTGIKADIQNTLNQISTKGLTKADRIARASLYWKPLLGKSYESAYTYAGTAILSQNKAEVFIKSFVDMGFLRVNEAGGLIWSLPEKYFDLYASTSLVCMQQLQWAAMDVVKAKITTLEAQMLANAGAKAAVKTAIQRALGTGATLGVSSLLAANLWGRDNYNGDLLQKGMRQNILSNIHQVGLVGGGYVITTPQKNIVYHTYIKSVADNVKDAVIYAGFDNDHNVNTSNRTVTFARNAFRGKTGLRTVRFHEINKQSSNTGMPMLLTIPDSAFVGCTGLTEFSTLMQTRTAGETRALGPENFVLGGDSIFAGLDPATFHIVIDPTRKQDFLDNESWAPLEKYFVYQRATPAVKYNEYGAQYAYAYELNSIKKEHKEQGHLIEHTTVIGPDTDFLKNHQGAVKLCNDIGIYNNYQLDEVTAEAFKDCQLLRSVTFTDLKGRAFTGDVYTGLQMHIGDRAFENCENLADVAMLYMVTDGLNRLDPIKPQQVTIGQNVFDGTTARIKMMPQQVAWFEADSAWAAYKDRFQPCIIAVSDEGVKAALKDMAFYDAASTGLDQTTWNEYIDYARIAGKGFSWLNGRFTAQKDKLRSFADFKYFGSVGLDYVGDSWFKDCSMLSNITLPSTIATIRGNAFKNCTALREIELPQSVRIIEGDAFAGCTGLNAIVVRSEAPAALSLHAFDAHNGLKIYVPTDKVETYKLSWSEYAQYIVGMDTYHINKVVTTTAVGQLAQKLGLTVTKQSGKVRYLAGPYAKYDSLTVSGPLNGEDLAVIRHLAGADAYDSNPTDGQLRYLNLWNADIKKDTQNSYNGNFDDEYIDRDNKVGDYLFENCAMIETVILPKSATYIGENVFEDAKALKRVAVGLNTTGYDTDLLQNLEGIDELAFITTGFAHNDTFWNDPWEADIAQVWTLPSQTGNYMGDPKLTKRAHSIAAPLKDENVMLALAEAGHYFPADYMLMESAENIFNGNLAITDLSDFSLFMGVKHLENTFGGMNMLETVTLPYSIETIGAATFSSCISLRTIRVSCDSVPTLAEHAFMNLPNDFQILVPKQLCKLYRTKWPQYADHINPDTDNKTSDEIITVTLTEANTLAQALGLTTTTEKNVWGWKRVNSLKGDYSRVRRLKVKGPISGADFDVMRYLAGYCPWGHCPNYAGHLEYIDLYDANIVESAIDLRSESSAYTGNQGGFETVHNDQLPYHAFLKAYSLQTLILPKTCKHVQKRALQECEGLETLVVGDDCEDFNWNALDDDAMLTRMYILAKKKPEISKQWGVWRWLCNNYNPTFDAFYVLPSLYQDYLTDEEYTGSSWQRTNNVSRGDFTDDDSFRFFASHAAATYDDLLSVTSIKGWADSHPDVKDLTALGYTTVSELPLADIQKLTKLEKIALPANVTTLDAGIFSKSPSLRYVDGLMLSDETTADIKHRGLAELGIDTLQTLVYLPQAYGQAEGTNIVVADGSTLQAETFRLVDGKDYCVPHAFTAGAVENSRTFSTVGGVYTLCLPYALDIPDGAKAYQLADRQGNALVFRQVTGRLEALQPYLLTTASQGVSLNTAIGQQIPASANTIGGQKDGLGYTLRGTLEGVDNKTLHDMGAYLMQSDKRWYPAPLNKPEASVPAFRCYLLQNGGAGAREFTTSLVDDEATAVETIRTIDADGTVNAYDLSGRRIDAPRTSSVIIKNGKKYIQK